MDDALVVIWFCDQVKEGDKLPAVKLKDQDGKVVDLSKYKGKPLVLYFYPADETPGCTKQVLESYVAFSNARSFF